MDRGFTFRGPVAALGILVVVAACSGGTSEVIASKNSGGLLEVSFRPVMSGGAGADPNAGALLPEVLLDELLVFRFDGDVDPAPFGGFVPDPSLPGEPLLMVGFGPGSSSAIPFHAFVDQAEARRSLQLVVNEAGAQPLSEYVVGRHRDRPDTLVIDPRMMPEEPGVTPLSTWYPADRELIYRIPVDTDLTIGGVSALPLGPALGELPEMVTGDPVLDADLTLFRIVPLFTFPPSPPVVTGVFTSSGASGTAEDPIGAFDALQVRFNRPIDASSVDTVRNVRVRNLDLATAANPEGTLLPVSITVDPSARTLTLVPVPSWGPGVDPSTGFNLRLEVGSPEVPLLAMPTFGEPASGVPYSGVLQAGFLTIPCPGCQVTVGIIEEFETADQRDPAFDPEFRAAAWGDDPEQGGALTGVAISGSPFATFNQDPGSLGTRLQVTVTPLPLATSPAGLASPFDDAFGNCLGLPGGNPCANPNGGAHILHLYEAVDLGAPRSSLELLEWGPLQDLVLGTSYPGYRVWAGQTSRSAPLAVGSSGIGLALNWSANYDQPSLQPIDPSGNGGVALSSGPQAYVTGSGGSLGAPYFPFPTFHPPFDYRGSGPGAGHLLIEQDIMPGLQLANHNRYRATATFPRRRLVGPPGVGATAPADALAGGFTVYDQRFTFVDVNASTQSLFYEVPAPSGAPTNVTAIQPSPSPFAQPLGTSSRWSLQGASAVLSPGTPAPGAATPWMTWFQGDLLTGGSDPSVLAALANQRWLRFRLEMRSNNLTNQRPLYESLVWVVSF